MQGIYDQKKGIILSLAIISLVMAFIAPAAIFYPLKAGFITLRNDGIGTSAWSIVTGGAGLILLSLLFTVMAFVKRPIFKWVLAIVLFVFSTAGILLSIRDYYYITKDEFVISGPFTLAETDYAWSDFAKFEEEARNVNGTVTIDKVIFTTKSGEILEFDGGQMVSGTMKETAKTRIQAAGGEIIRTFMDE
jgi:hypothetical protein